MGFALVKSRFVILETVGKVGQFCDFWAFGMKSAFTLRFSCLDRASQ